MPPWNPSLALGAINNSLVSLNLGLTQMRNEVAVTNNTVSNVRYEVINVTNRVATTNQIDNSINLRLRRLELNWNDYSQRSFNLEINIGENLSEVLNRLAELVSKVETLTEDTTEIKRRINEAVNNIQALRDDVKELLRKIRDLKEIISDLVRKIETLTRSVDDLDAIVTGAVETIEASFAGLAGDLAAITTTLWTVQIALGGVEATVTAIEIDVDVITSRTLKILDRVSNISARQTDYRRKNQKQLDDLDEKYTKKLDTIIQRVNNLENLLKKVPEKSAEATALTVVGQSYYKWDRTVMYSPL